MVLIETLANEAIKKSDMWNLYKGVQQCSLYSIKNGLKTVFNLLYFFHAENINSFQLSLYV